MTARDAAAALLGEHHYVGKRFGWYRCGCGARLTAWPEDAAGLHAAHLADVLADAGLLADDGIAAKIERSSFGTPSAKALRTSVPDEVAQRIVARANELRDEGGEQ